MENFFYTKTTKYSFIDNNILISEILPNAIINLEDFQINNEFRRKLIGENTVALLVDIRNIKTVSYEAREAARKEADNGQYIAIALLVENTISRMIAAIALGFNPPSIPLKVFDNQEKALNWLKEYANSNEKTQKYA